MRKRIWRLGVLLLLLQSTTTYKLTNSTFEDTANSTELDLTTDNDFDLTTDLTIDNDGPTKFDLTLDYQNNDTIAVKEESTTLYEESGFGNETSDLEDVTARAMPEIHSDESTGTYERIEHRVNLGEDAPNTYAEQNFESREVEDAVEYGLRKMNELVNVKEPELYNKGILLERNSPGAFLAAFNAPNEYALKLARYGYASLQAATKLAELYDGDQLSRQTPELRASLRQTALHNECPLRGEPRCRPASKRYRTSDGTCNNPNKPWWGSANTPQQRFLPPKYEDGLQSIRRSLTGEILPSAREISTLIHQDHDIEMGGITLLLMQWGQFLDHDITASAQGRGFNGSVPRCCLDGGRGFQPPHLMHPDCLPIAVPPNDWFMGQFGVRCMEFLRSAPTSRIDCDLGFREQINQVTSYIDASPIYGTSAPQADSQRTFRGGRLQNHRLDPRNPPDPVGSDICRLGAITADCLRPGDGRLREQPALTAFHIAFTRWHNMIAAELERKNPHWSDEKLYQESRRIVGATMQHITYKEFLPIVLGGEVMRLFDLELLPKGFFVGYEPRINPSAANSFTAAAFRFGHSLVQKSFVRSDVFHRPLFNNVSLHEEQSNFENIWSRGSLDRLILGMSNQASQRRDEFISEELTNHLFQTPGFPFGMDLAAINVQRGRDHGIPPYTSWRKPCGLSPITTWEELERVLLPEAVTRFKTIYSSVDDLDLYSAGLAEKPVRAGLVGPTFACIIAQQFSNLKKGDRFWYENGGFESSFTAGQLQQIRRLHFSEILCRTLPEIETLQPFVFMAPDMDQNRRETCKDLMVFDLEPWREDQNFLRSNPNLQGQTQRRRLTRQVPFIELLLPESKDTDIDLDRTQRKTSTRRKTKPKRTSSTSTPQTTSRNKVKQSSAFSSTPSPTEKAYHDDTHYMVDYVPNPPSYRPPIKPVFVSTGRPPQNDEEISILVPANHHDDINYLINTATKKPLKGDKPYNIHIQINYYLNGSDKVQMAQNRPPGVQDDFPDNPNNPYDQNDDFETPGYGSSHSSSSHYRPSRPQRPSYTFDRVTRPTSPPRVVHTSTSYYSETTKRPHYSSYYSTTTRRTTERPYTTPRPYVISNSNPISVVQNYGLSSTQRPSGQRPNGQRPNVVIIENSNFRPDFDRPDVDRYDYRPYDYYQKYEAKRPVIGTVMKLERPQYEDGSSYELPHKIFYMHGISYFQDNKYVQVRPDRPYGEPEETKFVKISSVKGHTTSTKHFEPVFVSVHQKEGELELEKQGGPNGTDWENSTDLQIEPKSEPQSEELPKPIDFIYDVDDYDYLFGLK